MPENTTQNIQFTVTDPDNPLSTLSLLATSDNQTLIPNSGLSINGLATNQVFGLPNNIGNPQTSLVNLGLTPAAFQTGTNNITITVGDPQPDGTNTVVVSFQLQVLPVVYKPFISKISAQSVAAGGTLTVPFTVGSPTASASTLTVGGKSDTQSLVKDANITTAFAPGDASGTNRVAMITSEAATTGGTANITLTVTDPANSATGTSTFPLTVRPSRIRNYTNNVLMDIVDVGPTIPYPAQVTVSGLVGPISKITATLQGFTHTYPDDVGVLLVPPSGRGIVLMNHSGDGTPAVNLSVTFDQSAANPIPQTTPLTTGSFKPFDYSPVGQRTFAGPAPAAPYTNTLNAFNGANPNGTWSLYVQDFSAGDSGWISNGWSLAVTTLPVINGLTDVTTTQDSPAVQAFTVADDTLSTPVFSFSGSSDNQSVVTNAGIVVTPNPGNNVTNFTVTVNPVPSISGSAHITLSMLNGDGQTVTATFKATFTPVIYPPYIFPIADQTIAAGSGLSIPINYGNTGLPQSSLILAFQSSNTNLVPVGNIKVVGSQLFASPVGVQTGTSLLTVSVTNPNSLVTTNTSFNLNVVPSPAPVFADSAAINIPSLSPASPYPSTINVSGLAGTVSKVTATVVGLSHTFPSDISMLLIGPFGQSAVLQSRAGGSAGIVNTRIAFDSTPTNPVLPQFTLITDGTYQPTDYNPSDVYYPPAPVGPYGHSLNVFNGTNPNGNWYLYVQDDKSGSSGVITGGWVLSITTTGPSISPIANQTTTENTNLLVNFSVSSTTVSPSNLIVTASHTGDIPPGLVGGLTLGGSGSARTLLISPAANLPSLVTNIDGTSTITLAVTDGTLTNLQSFQLTVKYVNQPPTITGLSDQTTAANVPFTLNFTVSDVDDPVSNLVVTASNTIPALGSVTLAGSGGSRSLTYTPAGALGTNRVIVTVSDSNNLVASAFNVVVTNGVAPVVSAIANQSIPKVLTNTPVPVTFTVYTGPLGATNLTVVATSTNTTLVPSVAVTGSGSNFTATATVAPLLTGSSLITVSATDQYGTGTSSFTLTVTPTNYPPTLGPIANQSTKANVAVAIPLTVSDPDDAITNLTFAGSSTNAALVSGVTFAFNGTTEVATVHLLANKIGQDKVTISVNDGGTPVSQAFILTVTAPTPPTFVGTIPNQTNRANQAVSVVLNVNSPDTPITNLTFTGTSTNVSLVSSITFTFNGTAEVATINLLTNKSGDDRIALFVSDGFSTNSTSFGLHITSVVQPKLTITYSGGQLHITATGSPNTSYGLLTSTDLKTWTDAGLTFTADATGSVTVTIPLPAAPYTFARAYVK